MFDLYEEFKAIVAALGEQGIDYAVCGGLAMAVWGAPRATVDIDLLPHRISRGSEGCSSRPWFYDRGASNDGWWRSD